MLRGDPYVARLMGGVRLTDRSTASPGQTGLNAERVGTNVSHLRPGDEVPVRVVVTHRPGWSNRIVRFAGHLGIAGISAVAEGCRAAMS